MRLKGLMQQVTFPQDGHDYLVQHHKTMSKSNDFSISGRIANASIVEGVSYSFKSKGKVIDEGAVRPDGSFEISFESRKKKVRGIVEFQDENGATTRNFTNGSNNYNLAAGEEDSLTASSKKGDQELIYSFRLSDPITNGGDKGEVLVPLPRPIEPLGIVDPFPPNPLAFDDSGILRQGAQVSADIRTPEETDWYRVSLRKGVRYTFNQRQEFDGIGDPTLRLYNPNGILVNDPVASDNVGGMPDSRLDYTAMENGTYFLVAGGSGFAAVHDYNISFNTI
jgi:hypothetical protein